MSYYNLELAVSKIRKETGEAWDAKLLIDAALEGLLTLLYAYDGELVLASIDGEYETAPPRMLDVRGIVRPLLEPDEDGRLQRGIVPVELVHLKDMRYTHKDGKLVRGARLPVEHFYGGRVLPGHVVECCAKDVNLGPEAIRFDEADLKAFIGKWNDAERKNETAEERDARRWQMCVDAGLEMPDDTYKHFPRGINAIAITEGITRQSFAESLNRHRERMHSKTK